MIVTIPRIFKVIRSKDHSGISGTGLVAQGVEFHTGQVVIMWCCKEGKETIEIHPSLSVFLEIHGHGSSTEVIFING